MNVHRFHKLLLLSCLLPIGALEAQSADQERGNVLSQQFSAALTHAGPNTSITVIGCDLIYEIIPQPPLCSYQGANRSIRTEIDLSEIEEIEVRPYRDEFIVRFDLDVPHPSIAAILIDRWTLDRKGRIERYGERQQSLLDQAGLNSAQVFEGCDGSTSVTTSLTHSIFLSKQIEAWSEFETLVDQCSNPQSAD